VIATAMYEYTHVMRVTEERDKQKIRMSEMRFLRSERFEFLTAAKIHVLVFWILTPLVLAYGYQRVEKSCCLHLPCAMLQKPQSEFLSQVEAIKVVKQ
jgi:hypothetical protein